MKEPYTTYLNEFDNAPAPEHYVDIHKPFNGPRGYDHKKTIKRRSANKVAARARRKNRK